jgi:hypothetical protein
MAGVAKMYRAWQAMSSVWKGRRKVFGIGMGKTGTTSLERAFTELGYRVGPQPTFERHFGAWAAGDIDGLLADIKRFEAFQDVPFCFPGTYRLLYKHFPSAKFILTVRDSPEQWYRSLCRFHSNLFGRNGALPTEADLQAATYVSPGWVFRASQVYGTPPGQPYDRATLIRVYETHVRETQAFFTNRPESLLVLNVADQGAFARLAAFLNRPASARAFPHLNKSA